jgi:hypothetical protein
MAQVAGIGQRAAPVILLCWVCFVARQVVSYRHKAGERRQQLKWLMSGGAICVVAIVAGIYAGRYSSPAADAVQAASGLAIAALPVAIGVGILKYRLYGIDRIISRTGLGPRRPSQRRAPGPRTGPHIGVDQPARLRSGA